MQWQLHQRPARQAVTALPGMGGVGALIVPTPQPVMLQVIDKFKQIHGNGGLTDKSCKETTAHAGQAKQKRPFEQQRTARVNGPCPEGTSHLPRDGLKDMDVHAPTPRRGRGVNIASPVPVMGVVVFRGEVEVEHGKERQASGPPALRAWSAVSQLMGGDDTGRSVVEAGRDDAPCRHGRQTVQRDAPEEHRHDRRNTKGVEVNDDVVGASFLKRIGRA